LCANGGLSGGLLTLMGAAERDPGH